MVPAACHSSTAEAGTGGANLEASGGYRKLEISSATKQSLIPTEMCTGQEGVSQWSVLT